MEDIVQCRAAVAWEPKKPLKIETIKVYPPNRDEVRIRMSATAICHTDAYTLSGCDPEGVFPCILGHEGAGFVDRVGPGVTSFEPGDPVILLYIPQCKECQYCLSPKTNLCSKIRDTQGQGLMPDGTTRFECNGKKIFHFMGCSTFSDYTVVSKHSLCKIERSAPLDKVCLFGCGVSTGYGAAINTAAVEEGSSCAIFGLGAVGLAVAMGCRERKASKITGIDINEDKFEIGREFGCTDFINPKELSRPIREVLIDISNGGYDYTFECVGDTDLMRVALESCHKGWGQSIIIGVAGAGKEISTKPFQLITGRTWKGSAFGGWKSKDSIPYLVEQHKEKKINLDSFITHKLLFKEINDGFRLLHEGKSIRTVVYFGDETKLPYLTYDEKNISE